MLLAELFRRTWRDVVGDLDLLTAAQGYQLTISVALDHPNAVALCHESVQNLHRLRPRGDVTGHDHEVGLANSRLGQHSLKNWKHPVNVRQDGHARDHDST